MKTINVSEATGPALDWLVAKAEGLDPQLYGGRVWQGTKRPFDPSTDWSQGGPIIERECIGIGQLLDKTEWVAGRTLQLVGSARSYGPTPLIAAIRCYVISELGETVEVPEELT